MTVFEAIAAQQKGKESTAPWMVGEQLAAICKADPACAELVLEDLKNPAMCLEAAERKIHDYADKIHSKTRKNVCVPTNVAEDIIRDFYGLPGRDPDQHTEAPAQTVPATTANPAPAKSGMLDLDLTSFF